MSRESAHITIRPRQPLYWLMLLGLLLTGMSVAADIYSRGVWVMAALLVVMLIGFVCDALVFDGQNLKRRGLWAAFCSQILGQRQQLSVAEIETISSYVLTTPLRRGQIVYHTLICGAGIRWEINSLRRSYYPFIKSLFRAVSSHKLDPRSCELLDYWQESRQLSLWHATTDSPGLLPPARLWRPLANNFTFAGEFGAAARYFHLARQHSPESAPLLYEMGRALYLCARLERQWRGSDRAGELSRRSFQPGSKAVKRSSAEECQRRATACLRLAGRLAGNDAALLERIGETFFEYHQHHLAQRYFEQALRVDPDRLRAQIGLAEVALRQGKIACVVHYYRLAARASEMAGERSLAKLTERKADYYERVRDDDGFLNSEMNRLNLLDNLKWARRGALILFLAAWFTHLICYQSASILPTLSRDLSATSALIWLFAMTASYFFSRPRH